LVADTANNNEQVSNQLGDAEKQIDVALDSFMQANKLAVDFKNKTKQTNSKKEGQEGEVPPLSKVSDYYFPFNPGLHLDKSAPAEPRVDLGTGIPS
jgi:hypothetical protein